jgi:CBS domain containing-hemolysin-like protein
MIMTIIFYALIAIGALLTFAGVTVASRIFWLAGLSLYAASYFADPSIGPFLIAMPVILWIFALAGLFRLLKKPLYYAIAGAVGVVVWLICYLTVEEWFFYPITWVVDNAYDLLRQAMDQGE